jgi:membrane protein DedA with SNARE-associated domain
MHFPAHAIVELVRNYGLLLLLPLAILEGPIVSVIAGWLIKLGYLQFGPVYVVCIAADLTGDGLLYCIGRYSSGKLPRRWFPRIFPSADTVAVMLERFHTQGGRILVVAKLTHSLGFAALLAAGAARMSIPAFFWFNLLATIPKSLFFILIGYGLGQAYATIDAWIWRGSVLVFVLACAAAFLWLRKSKARRA